MGGQVGRGVAEKNLQWGESKELDSCVVAWGVVGQIDGRAMVNL